MKGAIELNERDVIRLGADPKSDRLEFMRVLDEAPSDAHTTPMSAKRRKSKQPIEAMLVETAPSTAPLKVPSPEQTPSKPSARRAPIDRPPQDDGYHDGDNDRRHRRPDSRHRQHADPEVGRGSHDSHTSSPLLISSDNLSILAIFF